jgi:hypothetical protein
MKIEGGNIMELLQKRLANLLCVKSIVTIIATAVFSYLAIIGQVTPEQFMTVFTVIISFFFGTQAERKANEAEGK